MLLQGDNGVFAELVCWNLSCTDQSYALVKLDGGQIEEWNINKCRVAEECKTSKSEELAATVSQQLKQAIALVREAGEKFIPLMESRYTMYSCLDAIEQRACV
jgi:hypothetical protein